MQLISGYSNILSGSVEDIQLSEIVPSHLTLRTCSSNIDELEASIMTTGLLHPILIRINTDHFEIVAGNRRYYACKRLGWRKIPSHVVELDDKSAFEVSIVENVQRHTLSPLEEANAFKKYVTVFGWGSVSELALKMSKSPSYISRRMKLLDLPKEVLDLIDSSEINASAGEELRCIKDKQEQVDLAMLLREHKIPSKLLRRLSKDRKSECPDDSLFLTDNKIINQEKISKYFDKSIIALRITMNKLASIMEDVDDCWIISDVLMQHRNMINYQIDLLIRQKIKFNKTANAILKLARK